MQPLFTFYLSARMLRVLTGLLGVLCQLILLALLWWATGHIRPGAGTAIPSGRQTPRVHWQDHASDQASYRIPETSAEVPIDTAPVNTVPVDAVATDAGADDTAGGDASGPALPASRSDLPDQAQIAAAQRRAAWKKKPEHASRMSLNRLPGMKNIPSDMVQPRTVQEVYAKEQTHQELAAARLQELSGWHMHQRIAITLTQLFEEYQIPFQSSTPIESSIAIRMIFDPQGTIIATEVIESTGYPELDGHLCSLIMRLKRLELPAQQEAGTVYSYTLRARVHTQQGTAHFQFISSYIPGMYRS